MAEGATGRRARPWRRARELEASLRHGVAGGECARREQGRAPPSGPRTADLEVAVVVRLAMVARQRCGTLEAGRPLTSPRAPRRGQGGGPLTTPAARRDGGLPAPARRPHHAALELGSSARRAARPRPSSGAQGGGRKCRGAGGSRRGGRRGLPPSSSLFERRRPPREEWPSSSAAVRAGEGRARAPSSRARRPPLAVPRARRPRRRGRCREEGRAGEAEASRRR